MIQSILQTAKQWLTDTPERSLEQAYQAALTIQAIENKHFNGQKVSIESNYSNSVAAYFQAEIKKYLKVAKTRLAVFKASRSFPLAPEPSSSYNQKSALILERLSFIDRVISKYEVNQNVYRSLDKATSGNFIERDVNLVKGEEDSLSLTNAYKNKYDNKQTNEIHSTETVSDKTGVLPRSFLRTLNRIKQEIDPNSEESEEAVLKKFRKSRNKTAVSIKFFLLLIIVPLLTHQLTKTFVVSPLVDYYFDQHAQVLFINQDLEEEAFIELQRFEESLRFKSLLGLAPRLTPEEVEEQLQEKALDIADDFQDRGGDAIKNVFADIFSLAAFALIIVTSKREILIVKSFIDEIIYGLSDSAKAFLIILVTDMFVGYHSPHGWEVILQGVAHHFGIPENREFDYLFIATFPVILDTVLKYWIFRYLNRISPSAVATYRNMNE